MSTKRKMKPTKRRGPRPVARKYDNDYCLNIAKAVQEHGLTKVAKMYGLKYHDVQYINKQYYTRMARGEYDARKKDNNTPKGRVYLKPRVVGFKNTESAWDVIEKTFNDEQLGIVIKFYNTIIFEQTDTKNGALISADYEKV